jgi:hypothetical protein
MRCATSSILCKHRPCVLVRRLGNTAPAITLHVYAYVIRSAEARHRRHLHLGRQRRKHLPGVLRRVPALAQRPLPNTEGASDLRAAYRNRTDDLRITSASLYPSELRRRGPARAAALSLPCSVQGAGPPVTPSVTSTLGWKTMTRGHSSGKSMTHRLGSHRNR